MSRFGEHLACFRSLYPRRFLQWYRRNWRLGSKETIAIWTDVEIPTVASIVGIALAESRYGMRYKFRPSCAQRRIPSFSNHFVSSVRLRADLGDEALRNLFLLINRGSSSLQRSSTGASDDPICSPKPALLGL